MAHGQVAPARFCPACGAPLPAPGGHGQHCSACGRVHHRDPKVGVGAVVRDEAGRLLLVRRGVAPERGRWALPAGFVDADEDPREAVRREVLEETGLQVRVGRVVDVYPREETATVSFFVSFEAEVEGGALAPGDDATDAAFFAADGLPDIVFASTRDAAARLGRARARGR